MNIETKYLDIMRTIFSEVLLHENAVIYLFGSRARGDNRISSDIDLAIKSNSAFLEQKLAVLKDRFEESDIPYTFDIVPFSTASDKLKAEIEREGVEVWQNYI